MASSVYEGTLSADPSVAPGVPATIGAVLVRVGTLEAWQKIGAADTDWRLIGTGISPLSFGARFDGITDDTAALQAAVDEAIRTSATPAASGLSSVTVAAADGTYSRQPGPGSFLNQGFAVGMTVHWSGFTNAGNNGTKVITALSAKVMTVDARGLVDETNDAAVGGRGPGLLIVWPPGETVWSDTIRVSSITGLRILGSGIKATTARWNGPAGKPGFKFDGTQDCGLGHMRITIGTPGALSVGGLSVTVSQASRTYTRATGSFVADGFAVGHTVTWSGFPGEGNNATSVITGLTDTEMTVDGATSLVEDSAAAASVIKLALDAVVEVCQDVGTIASTRHTIHQLQVLGGGRVGVGVHYRLHRDAAGHLKPDVKNDLHVISESQLQGYADTGIRLEGYNAKKLLFSQVLVQGRATGHYGIDTGSIPGHGGSFSMVGGECQENQLWDFRLGKPNDPILVSGVYSQSSSRWFTVLAEVGGPQPTEVWPITFDAHRWATTLPELPPDKVIVDIGAPGPVTIRGSKIGGNVAVGTLRFRYRPRRISGFAKGRLGLVVPGPRMIAADEQVTLGSVTYTWKSALVDGGLPCEVRIGPSVATSLENLAAAINQDDGEGVAYGRGTLLNPLASANRIDPDTLEVTARSAGSGGNTIQTGDSMAHYQWSGATLLGGVDGVFENTRGHFSFEDSVLSSAQADDDIFTHLPPDSLKGAFHYDNRRNITALIPGQGAPWEAGFFIARRDSDWTERGMPIPRVWHLAHTSTGFGQGLVLDMQTRDLVLDLHPSQMDQTQYGQVIAPWTRGSIRSTGAPGQGMLLADTSNLIDTRSMNIAMGMHGILEPVATPGHLMVLGGGSVGASGGPLVRVRSGDPGVNGTLEISCNGATVAGSVNHADGHPHTIVALIDHDNKRLMLVTDLDVIDYVAEHPFPTPAQMESVAGKGLGTNESVGTWKGSWRKFFCWTGADVHRIQAVGRPGRWRPGDIIPLLRLQAAPLVESRLTAADFTLSSGWGASPSKVVAPESTESRGSIQVAALSDAGIGPNPTVTLTFKDGPRPTAPFAVVARNDAHAPVTPVTWTTTTTSLVITFHGTPNGFLGPVYTIDWIMQL